MPLHRRRFLGRSLTLGGSVLIGCGDDTIPVLDMGSSSGMPDAGLADAGSPADLGAPDLGTPDLGPADSGVPECANPFAGGETLATQSFPGEVQVPLDRLFNQGWDGRLYTDLARLDPSDPDPVISNDLFYVRTRYPDLLVPPARWSLDVSGLATPTQLFLDELLPLERDMGTYVLECSGNSRGGGFGLLGAARWGGIPMSEVLDRIEIDPAATQVEISGFDEHSVPSRNNHSTPGAAWIFTFDDLASSGAFLATRMNGEALPPDHGEPVRLFVPNWYGCTCIKWVNSIRFVDNTEPSTSQMREFASRTHQRFAHRLASDFAPATMHLAAMPVRVEKWRVGGEVIYRVVGITWGGDTPTDQLAIRFDGGAPETVDVCPVPTQSRTWSMWTHAWRPRRTGNIRITMEVTDPTIPTRRLDSEYYARTVNVDEL
ncbi:MAG: molybdopterin-dependent oxidoreductase [Myxococcota bacterium]